MKFYNKGFTLVEILIAMAVIAVLAGVVLAGVVSNTDKARIAKAKDKIGAIHQAILMLETDTGCWPKAPAEASCKTPYVIESGGGNEVWDLTDTAAGLMGDIGGVFPGWNGPYLNRVPQDPWGNDYFLDTDYDIEAGAGELWAVVVGSFGPNGEGQNLYDDDDIIYIIISE